MTAASKPIEPKSDHCHAFTKAGNPCARSPKTQVEGHDYCLTHAKMIQQGTIAITIGSRDIPSTPGSGTGDRCAVCRGHIRQLSNGADKIQYVHVHAGEFWVVKPHRVEPIWGNRRPSRDRRS